jgi:hypothetical protein
MMGNTEDSSTDHFPTYEKISPPTGVFLVASDGVHRSVQSSVNSSKNGALILVGYETERISQQKEIEG